LAKESVINNFSAGGGKEKKKEEEGGFISMKGIFTTAPRRECHVSYNGLSR